MKKLILLIIVTVFAFPLWADITVDSIKGNVEIMPPGSAGWSKVGIGDSLPADCRISTGFNSSAQLLVNGETRISIKALSRLTIEEASRQNSGTQTTKLFLGTGRIRADVKKSDGGIHDFRVRTPVATAAVRGTEFGVGPGRLDVGEGSVRYTVGSYSFLVSRGQSSRIRIINGRSGLISPTDEMLAQRQVNSSTGTDGSQGGTSSSDRIGYAAIELR